MLKGKTAIITGGSRGIGKAIALELAKNGANIAIIFSGDTIIATNTAAEIAVFCDNVKAYKCDVGSFTQTKSTIDEIINEFGGVDILVNNAGITRDGLLLSMTEENFDAVINTNLKGAFNMTKHLTSHFVKKRKGKIVNITSVVGITGNAGQANYASAKAGLIGFTKSIAKELASRNINCNAIAPGFIATDMTDKLNEDVIGKIVASIPLKKMGDPKCIAKMAAFLASDDADYITGEVIKIDGGLCI